MISKEQVIRLLDEEISKTDPRSALNILLNFRVDPKPVHILAPDSYKKKGTYEGWCLFEAPAHNRCVGYCEDPWDEQWVYFDNSITDTTSSVCSRHARKVRQGLKGREGWPNPPDCLAIPLSPTQKPPATQQFCSPAPRNIISQDVFPPPSSPT